MRSNRQSKFPVSSRNRLSILIQMHRDSTGFEVTQHDRSMVGSVVDGLKVRAADIIAALQFDPIDLHLLRLCG